MAEEITISKERVRQIRSVYFSFCSQTSGKAALKIRRAQRAVKKLRAQKLQRESRDDFAPTLALLKARGITYDIVPCMQIETTAKECTINSKRVSVHQVTRSAVTSPRTKAVYARFNLLAHRVSAVDILVLHIRVVGYEETVYVIPSKIVVRHYGSARKSLYLHVPLIDRPVYNNNYPRVRWADYKDAWHHLAPPK
jgi:hypothetical protein